MGVDGLAAVGVEAFIVENVLREALMLALIRRNEGDKLHQARKTY